MKGKIYTVTLIVFAVDCQTCVLSFHFFHSVWHFYKSQPGPRYWSAT